VKMFTAGTVTSAEDVLAMNFLMDRDAEHRARDFAGLKAEVGTCDVAAPIVPKGALAGAFTWNCEHGRVKGELLLAPTKTPQIQSLTFSRSTP
jgi:D-alanyl-D-alanine-carboxypeptidase/D-alanyl-D-alanine-endopeptidase